MTDFTDPRNEENHFGIDGRTYRVKWHDKDAGEDYAFYVTINHTLRDSPNKEHKQWAIFEIFINSKNVRYTATLTALTRMISAMCRKTANIDFIAEELQEIFDPWGMQVVGNVQIKSLPDLVGKVLAHHLKGLADKNRKLDTDIVRQTAAATKQGEKK